MATALRVEIDVNELNAFFANYQKSTMPRGVKEAVLSGTKFRLGDLEASVNENGWEIQVGAPDIARKIRNIGVLPNVPVVNNLKLKDGEATGECSVYHPETGDYLGTFNKYPNGLLR